MLFWHRNEGISLIMCSKKKKKKKKQEVRQAGTKININSCTYRLLYNIICGVPKRFEGKRTDGRTDGSA